MRLDHLLSKEKNTSSVWINPTKTEEEVEGKRSTVQLWRLIKEELEKQKNLIEPERFLVVMRLGDTPVLIPNTMVKT